MIYRDFTAEIRRSHNSLTSSSEFLLKFLQFRPEKTNDFGILKKIIPLPSAPQTKFLAEKLDE